LIFDFELNSTATDSDRGRHSTLTQREGLTARALVGNDSTVPTVPNRQTIRKDGDRRERGPAENTPAHKSSYNVITNNRYYIW